VQVKALQAAPPQFVGRPDVRDKLLIVGTVAVYALVVPDSVPEFGQDVIMLWHVTSLGQHPR
jgi:hypothetical protein